VKTMLVVVGDILLDQEVRGDVRRLCPDAPAPVVEDAEHTWRAGGAGLASTLAARDGAKVTLVTALGTDAAGERLVGLLEAEGIWVVNVGLAGATPEKIRIGTADRTLLRLDLGNGRVAPGADAEPLSALLETADAVLISDYGRGMAAAESVRRGLARAVRDLPVVWDPHPNGPPPVEGVRLATPNEAEVTGALRMPDSGVADTARFAEKLMDRWRCGSICVTCGSRGAVFVDGSSTPLIVPARPVEGGDPCGAGDRFAVTAALKLADGALASESVVAAADSASRFVAAGGARSVHRTNVEENGFVGKDGADFRPPIIVATGGCFDILHAGHVALLHAAARLGDRLVVCINSDASVRRLKGPGRPLVPQEDRATLLRSIEGVDEVVVFEEDTPESVLEQVRPDLFVKGGDYAGTHIPEADVVARWGGRAVVVPYLEGRSTSAIVGEAIKRAEL
jgi:D-beta-D-heptose 7-phosphate kinase / D-beta-D-heptose 1-phosphate adenosyltransferase